MVVNYGYFNFGDFNNYLLFYQRKYKMFCAVISLRWWSKLFFRGSVMCQLLN